MSTPSRLNRWPCFPDIPIILDAQDELRTPLINGTTHQTQHASRTPDGRLFQFIRVMSPIESGNPCVQVPAPEKAHQSSRNQHHRPTLRSFLPTDGRHSSKVSDSSPHQAHWGRQPGIRNKTQRERSAAIVQLSLAGSQVPFNSSTISEKTVQIDPESGCKTAFGLGIVNDTSNVASTTAKPSIHQRDESAPDIAQRIEERLWQYTFSGNVVKRWLLEIISWLISAVCMGVIVGVLLYLEGDKLPILPLGLTLNAYIAVLSKIASAALLLPASEALGQLKWSWFQGDSKKMWDFEIFDNASRGPWGSILLLIRTKGRSLAALGAAVTLLSLALDPFFQQVVVYPDRWTTLEKNSSVPAVILYDAQPEIFISGGKRVAQKDQDLQGVVDAFFYGNGTNPIPFGNGTRAEIPVTCPANKCTWDRYETLGVCSSCTDISQELKFDCLTATIDWISNLTGPGTESTYPNGTVCGYFLNATINSPSPVLMSGYLVNDDGLTFGEALLMRALPLITLPKRRPLLGGSINFKYVRQPIADFLVVSAANGAASVYRNDTPAAHECVVSWCVKTIQSSYYWANYYEEVVDTFINTTTGPYPWQEIEIESAAFNGTRLSYTENVTIDASPFNSDTSKYGVDNVTALTTIALFDDMFPSFLTAKNVSAEASLRFKTVTLQLPTSRTLNINPWSTSNNLTLHVERLAAALTNAIRSSSSGEKFLGTAASSETYVAVRWIWLSLPLGVLVLCFVFLAATVVKSSTEREHVGIWKTSALATLLYGFPDDLQQKITRPTSVGTPLTKAKKLRIKLLPEKGWRISGNLFSPMKPKVRQRQPPPGWI